MSATKIVAAEGNLVTAATDTELVGEDLYDIEGVEETFGSAFRHVAGTREPLTVLRMWRGAVWETRIGPFEAHGFADGIYIEATELTRIVQDDLVTLERYVELSTRISAALGRGELRRRLRLIRRRPRRRRRP